MGRIEYEFGVQSMNICRGRRLRRPSGITLDIMMHLRRIRDMYEGAVEGAGPYKGV